jgi:uncharacterized protein YdeI (BOF family)
MRLTSIFAAIIACFSVSALAQQSNQGSQQSNPSAQSSQGGGGGGGMQVKQNQTRAQKFQEIDADHNGSISKTEAAADPDMVIIWSEIDSNGDGQVDAAEFRVVPLTRPDGTAAR